MTAISIVIEVREWLAQNPTDSLGTRLAHLRLVVCDGFRGLRAGIDRLGEKLGGQDRARASWLERLRGLLILSQAASMKALRGLLNEKATYKTLDESLRKSLTLAKTAAERLRES